jgi:lipopolysaccharide export system permease protein
MRLIDKYITKSIFVTFLGTLIIFCALYILIDTTGRLDEFIDRKVPINIIMNYYMYALPDILVQAASISCLIAVLLTYAQLSNTNEIMVMRASGMTFWKIVKPALIFSLLISALIFLINERFVPFAAEKQKEIKNSHMILEIERKQKVAKIVKNLTFYGLKNRLYFIDSFSGRSNELNGITILEYDNEQNLKQKVVALNGKWTGIAWKFYKCQITTFGDKGVTHPTKVKVYNEKLMDIKETPRDFMKQRLNVKSMNVQELDLYIKRFSDSGAIRALNKLRVDYHQKIAFPFGNFVIVLVGLPFALMMRNRKGTTFTSLGIAIGIGFLYYVGDAVALALGKGGALPPLLSAWTAPIIFTGVGLLIIEFDFAN